MISASARPVIPRPMRRFANASRRGSSNGKRETSIVLSIMRTAMRTSPASSSSSMWAPGVKAWHTRRAEQASTIGRQRFLAAGVGRADGLAVSQVVAGIDPIDEDHARLGIVVGGPRDAVPHRFGADGTEHL